MLVLVQALFIEDLPAHLVEALEELVALVLRDGLAESPALLWRGAGRTPGAQGVIELLPGQFQVVAGVIATPSIPARLVERVRFQGAVTRFDGPIVPGRPRRRQEGSELAHLTRVAPGQVVRISQPC